MVQVQVATEEMVQDSPRRADHKVRALALLTVSDHLLTHEALSSGDREQSFGEMIEIALTAALG